MADPDLQIRCRGGGGGGGGHPDPEIRGVKKNFFSALRASFWSENKGRRVGDGLPFPPESTTDC